jgi:uncharacterized protein (TIGR02996 family)
MSEKTCFVIMPYTGRDGTKRDHYIGIYRSIIEPAARQAGYKARRSDLDGGPGSITLDVIRDLASADMVIADLTEANANVFLELGIRHVLRKSGTVHIIDKSYHIPFDINNYRAIEYSTNLAEVPQVIEEIVKAIKVREQDLTRSDNPVHDALTSLPIDVRTTGDEELRKQIEYLQRNLEELRAEKNKLQERLSSIDPNYDIHAESSFDIDKILLEADEITATSGESVLIKLFRAQEVSKETFAAELKTVLRSAYLSDTDYLQISRMCTQLGLPAYARAALEVARSNYPDNSGIIIALADAYYEAGNNNLFIRGRQMIEAELRIQHTNGKPVFTEPPVGDITSPMITLLNYYLRSKQFEWIISVIDSIETFDEPKAVYVRNKARALHKLQRNAEAEAEFQRAIALDPFDDTTYAFYADFLDDGGRYEDAYIQFEKAIVLDPNDGNRYSSLANHIVLRGIVRTSDGSFLSRVPKPLRVQNSMPLYYRAIQTTPRILNRVANNLVVYNLEREAQSLVENAYDPAKYLTHSLDYVDKLIRDGDQNRQE